MRAIASGTERPICWDSTTRRNSDFTGSLDSLAISRSASLSGRPDLIERTMTSSAFGNSSMNFLRRRLSAKLTKKRGMPAPTTKAMPSTTKMFMPPRKAKAPANRPSSDAADIELGFGKAQAGLHDLGLEGRGLLLVDLFLLLLEFLQRILHRFAALGHFGEAVARGLDLDPVGLGRLDLVDARLGLLVVLDAREKHAITDRARRDGGQRDDSQYDRIETEHSASAYFDFCSISSIAAASRLSSPK